VVIQFSYLQSSNNKYCGLKKAFTANTKYLVINDKPSALAYK